MLNKIYRFSEETRRKMSESHRGHIVSEETKRKISITKLGKTKSDETKRKMSIRRIGLKHSEETKRKISETMKGKHTSTKTEFTIESRAKLILPFKDSSIEVKIQNFLKQLGIEFFTHQYIKIEHGYQCDILIPSMNLVIECDGDYWHKYPIGLEKDHIRTKELIEKGFKVLRLWGREIKVMNINKFKEKLGGITNDE